MSENSLPQNLKNKASVGVEIEQVFTNVQSGESHSISPDYFQNLKDQRQTTNFEPHIKELNGKAVEVDSEWGATGLDNGWNLGESAIGPVSPEQGGLLMLNELVNKELAQISKALSEQNAAVLNMSNHPLGKIDKEYYLQTRVPKPLYDYLNNHRRNEHMVGIDAKAQNSPSTGVSLANLVEAVNVIMAASPAFVALFGNSPFAQGKLSGVCENRLTIWERMFKNSISKGDIRLHNLPQKPFNNLRDYFNWMFGPDTKMFFVAHSSDYKKSSGMVVIPEHPSILEFLKKPQWQGHILNSQEKVTTIPSVRHLELHQFAQFGSARIRYQLKDEFLVQDFLSAMSARADEVEQLFDDHINSCYIEGRDPGANFLDENLYNSASKEVSASVTISPSALQFGLIANLKASSSFLSKFDWKELAGLRSESIKHGMAAEFKSQKVINFCKSIVDLAAEGLSKQTGWMLEYPKHVIAQKKNGAQVALDLFNKASGSSETEKIKQILQKRILRLVDFTI